MAELVLCEGSCNRPYRAEVKREGDAFRFFHVEEYTVHTDAGATRIEGQLVEHSIALDADSSLLVSLDEPFGLAVAKAEQ